MTEAEPGAEADSGDPEEPQAAEAMRPAEALKQVEDLYGGRVIAYVSNVSLGPWDIPPFYRFLTQMGHQEKLSVLVQSEGGYADDAFKLANLIHEFGKQVTFIVPSYAKSAATLRCLSGSRILMGPTSELGPTNPMMKVDHRLITPTVPEQDAVPKRQTRRMATHALKDFLIAADVLTPEGGYDPEKLSVYMTKGILNPFLLGEFERSNKTSLQYAESLLQRYMLKDDNAKARETARALCEDYFDHGYPIGRKEARDHLGLKVEDMSDDLWRVTSELVAAYDQMMEDQDIRRIIETADDNYIQFSKTKSSA